MSCLFVPMFRIRNWPAVARPDSKRDPLPPLVQLATKSLVFVLSLRARLELANLLFMRKKKQKLMRQMHLAKTRSQQAADRN